MNPAQYRSTVRRAVLAKTAAAADPAQVAGVLGLLGGGALAGSAVSDDDQSALKRIGKGTLGAGLAYGGYKAMTDPKVQQGIRTGTQKAVELVQAAVAQLRANTAKTAETAFDAGFCDVAAECGVDPVALAKCGAYGGAPGARLVAGAAQRIGPAIPGAVKRVGGLAAGAGRAFSRASEAAGARLGTSWANWQQRRAAGRMPTQEEQMEAMQRRSGYQARLLDGFNRYAAGLPAASVATPAAAK
jgi:hypothetical protein